MVASATKVVWQQSQDEPPGFGKDSLLGLGRPVAVTDAAEAAGAPEPPEDYVADCAVARALASAPDPAPLRALGPTCRALSQAIDLNYTFQ